MKKYCIACKWSKRYSHYDGDFLYCDHPNHYIKCENLVDGKYKSAGSISSRNCYKLRQAESFCGEEGEYFEFSILKGFRL
jgi:hypothetical protein